MMMISPNVRKWYGIMIFTATLISGCATVSEKPVHDTPQIADLETCIKLVEAGNMSDALDSCHQATLNNPESFAAHTYYAKAL
ncbi:hypothetical protein JW979_07685, partial [bacterium]|nr:hypothetical protein [candidate division CSSED10-310 bacterium]